MREKDTQERPGGWKDLDKGMAIRCHVMAQLSDCGNDLI